MDWTREVLFTPRIRERALMGLVTRKLAHIGFDGCSSIQISRDWCIVTNSESLGERGLWYFTRSSWLPRVKISFFHKWNLHFLSIFHIWIRLKIFFHSFYEISMLVLIRHDISVFPFDRHYLSWAVVRLKHLFGISHTDFRNTHRLVYFLFLFSYDGKRVLWVCNLRIIHHPLRCKSRSGPFISILGLVILNTTLTSSCWWLSANNNFTVWGFKFDSLLHLNRACWVHSVKHGHSFVHRIFLLSKLFFCAVHFFEISFSNVVIHRQGTNSFFYLGRCVILFWLLMNSFRYFGHKLRISIRKRFIFSLGVNKR